MDSRIQTRLQRIERQQNWVEANASQLTLLDQRFFWYRLTTFAGAWVFALLARFFLPGLWWLAAFLFFLLAFLVVVFFHRRLDERRLLYQSTVKYVAGQAARMKLDWKNITIPEMPAGLEDHPFARDLDLVGSRSLLHLLDQTTSLGGQQQLQTWLLWPQLDLETIQQRQQWIQDLANLPGLRRKYFTARLEISDPLKRWDEKPLLSWLAANSPGTNFNRWLIGLSLLALVNIILLILNLTGVLPAYWQFGLIAYAALYLSKHQTFKDLFQDAYTLSKSLEQIRQVFHLIEKYPYPANIHLPILTANLRKASVPPSLLLRKIARLTSAASLQNNQILWLLVNLLIPWDLWFARLLEQYKQNLSDRLPGWLETWYRMDALLSLAEFTYLHPGYTFPHFQTIQIQDAQPLLSSIQLGHPLLPEDVRVCNDFTIDQTGEIALISGSNMSGKSTFLRTIGINVALAFAGAPVNASKMQLGLLRLYTSIQVLDSLSDGFSYFYAEVRRLKRLLDLLQTDNEFPVFYLIDEIFRGTNNEERRTGSQAFIRTLAGLHGSGVISTHDLALTELAHSNPRIKNYHFRDDVVNGKMTFDYKLRPGPSPSTNALKIMQIEGLPV